MTKTASTLAIALATLVLAGGCGDDDDNDSAGGTTATTQTAPAPQNQALAEVDAVRTLLARAVDQYESGDAKGAERSVGDAYLEHFEEVEHPLEEEDPELMESLEVAISTTLRERIKAGASQSAIERLVAGIRRDLDRAEAALE